MTEEWTLSLGFGGIAGLLSGLLGIGGGVIIVPFLLWLFPRLGFSDESVMVMAVGTSLSTIVITSLSATLAQQKRGALDWGTTARLSPGILLGSMGGSMIAGYLPAVSLKLVFAGFLFYVAIDMLSKPAGSFVASKEVRQHPLLFMLAGLVIGALSSILGIGGGTLSVPFLIRQRFPIRSAVAISTACGFPLALAGTATYAALGWSRSDLPPASLGFIYLPAFACITLSSVLFAPLGVRLAYRWPSARLKRFLACILILIAGRMVWQLMPVIDRAVEHLFTSVSFWVRLASRG